MKNKVFQEGGVTTIGVNAIGTSTTLESNKSHLCYFQTMRQKVLSLIASPRKAKKDNDPLKS